MSPQKHSGEISLYQRPPYVIHLQTVWRLYGDGMETHLSVNGRRKYSRRVQQPLPTDIDLIRPVQAFELRQ